MAITAAQVKELREMTGAGMMDCKKVLVQQVQQLMLVMVPEYLVTVTISSVCCLY